MPETVATDLSPTAPVTTPLEIAGVVTTIICVWLAAVNSVWNFPVAIVSCGCYLLVFARARLYSDAGLQLAFLLLGVWGWYQWAFAGTNQPELPIGHVALPEAVVLGAAALVFAAVAGFLFARYTNAALPYWDSSTTAISLAAQVLLSQRLLENWYLWIAVDVVYVLIYWRRRLYFTSALYVVLTGLAIYGLWQWQQEAAALTSPAVPAS